MAAKDLIPRRVLFDNPVFAGPRLSPDGKFISWLAPVDGVLNIWLAAASDIGNGEPVTRTKGRPIQWQAWTADGRFLMYSNDENGDENRHIFLVDPQTRDLRDVTPLPKISAQLMGVSRQRRDTILIGLNNRDERWHDLYTLDLASGKRTLLWENTQSAVSIETDHSFTPRVLQQTTPEGGAHYQRIDGTTLTPWFDVSYEDNLLTGISFFHADDNRVVMRSVVGRDKAAYYWRDLATDKQTLIAEHPSADCTGLLIDPKTYTPLAVRAEHTRQQWLPLDQSVGADLAWLEGQLPGADIGIVSQTEDNRRWIVVGDAPDVPMTYQIFDRDAQTLTELACARPALRGYRLAPMHPVIGKSRDGLDLVSFLTLPADVAGPRPTKPLPMVLVVHGGPWSRDTYGYAASHQWLANRGYAVLSVNYRASTGFGKAFIAASEKEHGRKMHDDLIDMVDWAIREGIADKDKIAIHGGSYGGLASFYGATFTPDVFACSIPVVGITNLQTLMESMPPYWAGFAEFMYRSYGDPRTEAGRQLLAERSPINRVDAIKKPMLIFHGLNDVRCKVAESDTIAAAMQAKGIPVTYVVYPDEGHGFAKPANRLSYIAMMEAFLAKHLGGECEPVGTDLDGSSHDIRTGRDELARLGVA